MDGSAKKDPQRVNRNEPQPSKGAPVKPKHLQGFASEAWDVLVNQLDDMGILTQADGSILELYSITYQLYREALERIQQLGQVLVTKKGGDVEIRRNPFSVELHKHRDSMNKMLAELGLTPTARTKISVSPKVDDAEARFFGKHG